MDVDDYISRADAEDIGTPVNVERRKSERTYNIANAGALGRNILNDIAENIRGLKPVAGNIRI